MSGTWSIRHVFVAAAVVLAVVAFIVALGDLASNWQAWLTAAAVCFFAAFLPWRGSWGP